MITRLQAVTTVGRVDQFGCPVSVGQLHRVVMAHPRLRTEIGLKQKQRLASSARIVPRRKALCLHGTYDTIVRLSCLR
jgi:hypothetical protein